RVTMARRAFEKIPGVEMADAEVYRGFGWGDYAGYEASLARWHASGPGDATYFHIMGVDVYNRLATEAFKPLETSQAIVVPRQGTVVAGERKQDLILEYEDPAFSSTRLRKELEAGNMPQWLDGEVV